MSWLSIIALVGWIALDVWVSMLTAPILPSWEWWSILLGGGSLALLTLIGAYLDRRIQQKETAELQTNLTNVRNQLTEMRGIQIGSAAAIGQKVAKIEETAQRSEDPSLRQEVAELRGELEKVRGGIGAAYYDVPQVKTAHAVPPEASVKEHMPRFSGSVTISPPTNPPDFSELGKVFRFDADGTMHLVFLPETDEKRQDGDALLVLVLGRESFGAGIEFPVSDADKSMLRSGVRRRYPKDHAGEWQRLVSASVVLGEDPDAPDLNGIAKAEIECGNIRKVALSRGGAYALTDKGRTRALIVLWDMVERA